VGTEVEDDLDDLELLLILSNSAAAAAASPSPSSGRAEAWTFTIIPKIRLKISDRCIIVIFVMLAILFVIFERKNINEVCKRISMARVNRVKHQYTPVENL